MAGLRPIDSRKRMVVSSSVADDVIIRTKGNLQKGDSF